MYKKPEKGGLSQSNEALRTECDFQDCIWPSYKHKSHTRR